MGLCDAFICLHWATQYVHVVTQYSYVALHYTSTWLNNDAMQYFCMAI